MPYVGVLLAARGGPAAAVARWRDNRTLRLHPDRRIRRRDGGENANAVGGIREARRALRLFPDRCRHGNVVGGDVRTVIGLSRALHSMFGDDFREGIARSPSLSGGATVPFF